MSEVRTASGTGNFIAAHSEARIVRCADCIFVDRLPKARPSCPGIVFCVPGKQWITASGTNVGSFVMIPPVRICERQFGAAFSQHVILATGQDVFPFVIREMHFLIQRDGGELGTNSSRLCLVRLGLSARANSSPHENTQKCEEDCSFNHHKPAIVDDNVSGILRDSPPEKWMRCAGK